MSAIKVPFQPAGPTKSIDERIAAMEAALPRANLAGTTLKRVLGEESGLAWSLAMGTMDMPKTFFRGPTIEDVLAQAETAIANMTDGRLATDWDMLESVVLIAEA
jgi:hypothetical protein